MILTKEQALHIANGVMKYISKKLNLEILENKEILVEYSENLLEWKKFNIERGWDIIFPAYNFQFQNDEGFYSITINDETQQPIYFINSTGGRSCVGFIKKSNEEKYYIDWQP
ncbi:hypothetical protein [Chryseobacterium herbae]|uniref:Immunity protein 35 domain-containing protein n=1 Tax=Chryseobacterium herbae TaxID=2976476 RepID=A0ABT2IXR1_9FLAO|nr:hypothetical protein [Chryseobacterium sp. pc1-10]MCT2563390.1 hypothetical protein [Chryseobacterium sp. pc1-10]